MQPNQSGYNAPYPTGNPPQHPSYPPPPQPSHQPAPPVPPQYSQSPVNGIGYQQYPPSIPQGYAPQTQQAYPPPSVPTNYPPQNYPVASGHTPYQPPNVPQYPSASPLPPAPNAAMRPPIHPSLAPPTTAMDQLTGQMQNLSTAHPSQPISSSSGYYSQPVGIIGQPLPLDTLRDVKSSPISPQLNPAYMRITLNKVPKSAATLHKTRLPLGLTVTPYPSNLPSDAQVPVINGPIVRCRRCRTYINPYVEMIDQGAKWRCNLCYLDNDFPPNFDYDPATQQYLDRATKSELITPVYEFVAPVEYMVRPPQPPVYLFLIDVTFQSVTAGILSVAAKVINESLESLPNVEGRTKIGIMSFDSTIHFYSISPASEDSKMLVVSDLEDPFIPASDDLLVSLSDCKVPLEKLLTKLSTFFANTQVSSSALGPALNAASKLLAPIGGKIVLIQSSPPALGDGKINNREEQSILGTPKENALLQPVNSFYKSLATECSRNQVAVDMFLFPLSYLDVATISCAAKFTGGKVFLYPQYNSTNPECVEKFVGEFSSFLKDEHGLEAVLRIRASQGVTLSQYHGSFFLRSTDLMALPNVNPRHSFSAQVTIEENLNSKLLCFQTAVLHTSCTGERRIRVINAAYPISDDPRELILNADIGALSDILHKMAIEKALSNKLEDARDAVTNKINDVLVSIRTAFQTGQNPQLLLTENLRLLPLMCLSILKAPTLRGGNSTPSDLRSYYMVLAKTMSVEESLYFLYPYFFGIHSMTNDCGSQNPETGDIVLPPQLPLCSDQLERHGLFVIDNGIDIFIWVGSQIHPELCKLIFDCSFTEIKTGKISLPILENPWSQRVHIILSALRRKHRNCPIIHLVREDCDSHMKFIFLQHMIEDKFIDQPAYSTWAAALRDKLMTSR